MIPGLYELIEEGSKFLVEQGFHVEDAKRDAERLLLRSLGISKSEIILTNPSSFDETVKRDFLSLLEKRGRHVPLQYIEGDTDFMDFSFRVSPDVLIPRPETENLVQRILVECGARAGESLTILDIGTGSGCILLSLLKYFPKSFGVGVDISEKAIAMAKENVARLGLRRQARFLASDFFDALGKEKFDLIVSNPPYVSDIEWMGLAPEVKQEPRIALVSGSTGLESYKKIISDAREFLKEDGSLFFEVGWNQADLVCELLESEGFKSVKKFLDDFGIERIVTAQV